MSFMKSYWYIISIISGIIGGVIALIILNNWKISLISGLSVFIIILFNNPKRRYIKAFWIIISLIATLNSYFFKLTSDVLGIDFLIEKKGNGGNVILALVFLAMLCLFLDFLERKRRMKGSLFNIYKNEVKNVSGSDIKINQENNNG